MFFFSIISFWVALSFGAVIATYFIWRRKRKVALSKHPSVPAPINEERDTASAQQHDESTPYLTLPRGATAHEEPWPPDESTPTSPERDGPEGEDDDVVYVEPIGPVYQTPSVAEVEISKLRNILREVWEKTEFSDLKIIIGSRTFFAHKVIIAVRCPSIMEKLSGGKCKVQLEGVEADVFSVVLEYIYVGCIDDERLDELNGDLLRAAFLLNMEDLKTLAEQSLLNSLSITNAAERIQLAFECESSSLTEPVIHFIGKNKNEVMKSPGWQSVRRSSRAKEIMFNLLNAI